MTHLTSPRRRAWIGPVIGLVLLASCGSASETAVDSQVGAPAGGAADVLNSPSSGEPSGAELSEQAADGTSPSALTVPAGMPQLAKQASLTLQVDAVAEAIDAVAAIARAQQGDILTLEDGTGAAASRQQAIARVRVPQDRLDPALRELAALGQVQQRQITAEDVSTQLVDLDARLRNLRKTEAMLLEIMDRSGSVAEVLQVAQEVSNVRASIEQVDAQLKQLRNRVSYSTVTITLKPAIAADASSVGVREELATTWRRATLSFRNMSVGLMKLVLWLLVYSPYVAVLVMVGVGAYYLRRRFVRL